MKILHTSDWHLGRSLYGRKRYVEFTEFLDWLSCTIETEKIDVLLISGDVFDTSTPGNRAQELYYRFLYKVSGSCCCHVVIIAGNHDSPSFLDAPKALLRVLNVYVVGLKTEDPEDELIVLYNEFDIPEAIVCAVPYLRDKDIRIVQSGETIEDKNLRLIEGLKSHYSEICALAGHKKKELINKHKISTIPVIAMGHLFTAEGKTVEGDGVRDLYVGSLAHVDRDVFPDIIDYAALGHLHVSQRVGDVDHIRYSGSPIPMGFGEAYHDKKVIVVEFSQKSTAIEEHLIPCFQPLECITGSMDEIQSRIEQLKDANSNAWLEIKYTGSDIISNLRDMLEEALDDTSMEIRRIKNERITDKIISSIHENETLDDLNENDVFERCLELYDVPLTERNELMFSYKEILQSLYEEDINAE
jgi:DNA repair protein SbcD/Mre11